MSSPILYGTTGPIGGTELPAAGCFTGTCTVTGATVGMPVQVTPRTFPGNGAFWEGFVSSPNTVTVKLCNAEAGTLLASIFDVSVFNSAGSGGGPTLETNGTPNGSQTLLNLQQGTNVTLTDNGSGQVTIAASGGGAGITLETNGTLNGSQTLLNLTEGSNVTLTDNGSGQITIAAANPGTGTVTHTAGALTADLPMFGAGGADSKVGTKSGNTDELATVSGAVTNGHLATWDANGNLVDGGAPATGNFTLISRKNLTVGANAVTFSSIPATYTDLLIVFQARVSTAANLDSVTLAFNGDNGANYNHANLYSTGGTPSGSNSTATTPTEIIDVPGSTSTAGTAASANIMIPNYKGTTFFKTALCYGNAFNTGSPFTALEVIQWANTAAITQIVLAVNGGVNLFVSGCVFSLYGMG